MRRLVTASLLTLTTTLTHADPLTVSEATTVYTEPLRDDGTVDYAAAINAQHADIPRENNAAVVLAQLEPADHWASALYRRQILERLGVDPDQPSPAHLTGFDREWFRLVGEAWTPADHPDLAAFLERHQLALDTFANAAHERTAFWWPIVPFHPDDDRLVARLLPQLSIARNAARILALRAMQRMQSDQPDAACDDLAALFAWSRRIQPPVAEVIEQLVAISLQAIAIATGQSLLNHPACDATTARRLLDDLHALPPLPLNETVINELIVIELWSQLITGRATWQDIATIEEWNSGYPPPDDRIRLYDALDNQPNLWRHEAAMQPNTTLAHLREPFAQIREARRVASVPQHLRQLDAIDEALFNSLTDAAAFDDERAVRDALAAGNPDAPWAPFFERTLLESCDGLYAHAIEATRCQSIALLELHTLATAQRLHALTADDFAPDWQTLIDAGLIDAAPIDPLADPPAPYRLRIDDTGCTLYSVGTDFDDDAGMDRFADNFTPTGDDDHGDLVVHLTRHP